MVSFNFLLMQIKIPLSHLWERGRGEGNVWNCSLPPFATLSRKRERERNAQA
jgi:hypothetical protein